MPKEVYPNPTDIPEGRWGLYEVTLPSRPTHTVTVHFYVLTDTISLSHEVMTFDPDTWDRSQDLLVFADEDRLNLASPYDAAFSLALSSTDKNFDLLPVPDYNVTIEDNDDGI